MDKNSTEGKIVKLINGGHTRIRAGVQALQIAKIGYTQRGLK